MRNIRVLLIAFVVAASDLLFAQAPANTSFETASVKPSDSGSLKSGFRVAGEQFTATNVYLSDLIRAAYQLRIHDERLPRLPEWAQTARYTVIAKAPAGIRLSSPDLIVPDGAEPSTVALMVRELLADRFRLRMHTETRSMRAYALVMARGDRQLGPNLKNCSMLSDPTKCGVRSPSLRLVGNGFSMAQLGNALSMMVQRPVVDRTELQGAYDITLDYVPDETLAPEFRAATSNPDGPSLFTALEEQLGLKLESTKSDIDYLIVDSVSQPEPD